jgi:flagellar motor component MotA
LETKNQLVELANLVRKDGVLALETKAEEIKDPFLKRAIDLMRLNIGITPQKARPPLDLWGQSLVL